MIGAQRPRRRYSDEVVSQWTYTSDPASRLLTGAQRAPGSMFRRRSVSMDAHHRITATCKDRATRSAEIHTIPDRHLNGYMSLSRKKGS